MMYCEELAILSLTIQKTFKGEKWMTFPLMNDLAGIGNEVDNKIHFSLFSGSPVG